MGGACVGGGSKVSDKNYDVDSACFADHYISGETLGRGAFGVVNVAQLKPRALEALNSETIDKPNVLRRRRFAKSPMAVKVMRHERNAEGDSVERLELQMQELQNSIDQMEKQMGSQDLLTDNEELQWHHDYMEILTRKLNEKRSNRTKKTPRENMLREVSLMQKCEHEFIMQHVETFEEASTFCVVFERCYGSVTNRYPDGVRDAEKVCRNGYQLMSAIAYLHGIFILHRDIKPENLMYRSGREDSEVVLGDFGMAVELRKVDDRCQGCAGTPHFVPPEGFHSYYQSFPSDCWACGCTLYWMLLGNCPFEVQGHDMKKTGHKSIASTGLYAMLRSTRMGGVLQGWKPQFEQETTAALARKIVHPREAPEFVDGSGNALNNQPAQDLIGKLLIKVPKDRLTATEALQHEWFGGSAAEISNGAVQQETGAALLPVTTNTPSKPRKNSIGAVVPEVLD